MGTHTPRHPSRRGRPAQVQAALDALRNIVQGVRVYSAQAERRTGLSGAQLFVLQKLAEAPAQSLNELAARTRTHQSSVSTVVARLVSRRLVSRRRSPADGRRLLLELTPAGRALLSGAPQTAQGRLIEALEKMPQRRRQELVEGLTTVVAALGTATEPAPLFLEPEE
jgi:MarR family transcriptional regulator, lower aerobic nicotinate degradation pathway regulator